MKKGWTYRDIIDLEYFFLLDSSSNDPVPEKLGKRDRRIYLSLREKGLINESSKDKDLVLAWTREMAASSSIVNTPGLYLSKVWKNLVFLMVIAGFITGMSAVSAVLYYKGEAPVNVAAFLGITILPHWFFIFLLAVRSIFVMASGKGKAGNYPPSYSFLKKIFGLIGETALRADSFSWEKIGASPRLWFAKLSKVYSSAFLWPLFILAQVFGLFVAISSLAVTIVRVAFTDLAFGWQSTLDTAPEKIHSVAVFLASPWSWFLGEGSGVPDAASVAGSRMVLKEGILSLSTPDLASWWPFLCLCIFFYAVLPRLFLLFTGILKARKIPGSLDYRHADCSHLIFRMLSPLFDTRSDAAPEIGPETMPKIRSEIRPEITSEISSSVLPSCVEQVRPDEKKEPAPKTIPVAPVVNDYLPAYDSDTYFSLVLVSGDFMDLTDEEKIIAEVSMLTGRNVSGIISYDPEPFFEKKAIEKLEGLISGKISFSVNLVMEAWQPPILEIIDFIRMIRTAIGNEKIINIIFAGKPEHGAVFTRPTETDRSIWATSLVKFADPYLMITEFGKYDA